MFGWSGNKASFMGDVPFYGPSGINFYTETKVSFPAFPVVDVHLSILADRHESLASGGCDRQPCNNGHAHAPMKGASVSLKLASLSLQ
jgi:hypothetical protein